MGEYSIAAHLNDTKEDTWGAGKWKAKHWHRSYIRKLLTNKAAIGIFVPHRVQKVEGKRTKERIPQEPIAHRFPAAVDRELFERVNARLSTTEARGKNAKARAPAARQRRRPHPARGPRSGSCDSDARIDQRVG